MFTNKANKPNTEPGTAQNRVNEGTKIIGDITSTGFFRIDGTVEGNITTPSKVIIGKTGKVIGNLICENADIEGSFEGILKITGALCLKSAAHVEGEVITGKLMIEPGAIFNATCIMQDDTLKALDKGALSSTKKNLFSRKNSELKDENVPIISGRRDSGEETRGSGTSQPTIKN